MSALTRFLGDSPLRVLIKFLIVSLIVGFLMSVFDWTPWDVFDALRGTILRIWDMGFAAIGDFLGYIVLGAVIVIPAFLILRLVSLRR
ncbi:DUF6460 domain-containing protein [Chelativorans sp.]|uniref:DUF6460 domain-containing protein n=1 Tax=Chelativorans sp. TaxID=2203393 RepID=UPI0028119C2D|nr:DUF6460 domain-containing protein [Chelativorans sp.]